MLLEASVEYDSDNDNGDADVFARYDEQRRLDVWRRSDADRLQRVRLLNDHRNPDVPTYKLPLGIISTRSWYPSPPRHRLPRHRRVENQLPPTSRGLCICTESDKFTSIDWAAPPAQHRLVTTVGK